MLHSKVDSKFPLGPYDTPPAPATPDLDLNFLIWIACFVSTKIIFLNGSGITIIDIMVVAGGIYLHV
jgi:hypothetical protein